MFTIITPTYKRADKLKRAIQSVQAQTFASWRMVIVNDSPDDFSYADIQSYVATDSRLVYLKNESNQGVNFSRNQALQYAQDNSQDDWIIFLDDDDWFTTEYLAVQSELIKKYPEYKWFVTNRVGSTKISPDYSAHSYISEWLIFRRLKGDSTHCLSFSGISDLRFSKKVKQGEEWIYFYQTATRYAYHDKNFLYHDFDATCSDGYTAEGLNFRPRSKEDKKNDLRLLKNEGDELGIGKYFGFKVYVFLRKIALLFK